MMLRELAERICSVLREAGHQAYFVGGCVRDLLLGREPADYDIATDATPDRVLELFPGSMRGKMRFGGTSPSMACSLIRARETCSTT